MVRSVPDELSVAAAVFESMMKTSLMLAMVISVRKDSCYCGGLYYSELALEREARPDSNAGAGRRESWRILVVLVERVVDGDPK